MIEKMKKFTFLVTEKEYDYFIASLRELGVVHVGIRENKPDVLQRRCTAVGRCTGQQIVSVGDGHPLSGINSRGERVVPQRLSIRCPSDT